MVCKKFQSSWTGDLEHNKVKETDHVMLQDFSRANRATVVTMPPHNALSQAWSAPSNGEIKINGDAGVSGNNGVAGIGFVMRSHSGSVLIAGSRRVNFSFVELKQKQSFGLNKWV